MIQQVRKALGLSQEQLASAVGLSRTAIMYFETGRRSPALETQIRLVKALRQAYLDFPPPLPIPELDAMVKRYLNDGWKPKDLDLDDFGPSPGRKRRNTRKTKEADPCTHPVNGQKQPTSGSQTDTSNGAASISVSPSPSPSVSMNTKTVQEPSSSRTAQDAPGVMERLEDRDRVAQSGKLACGGQAARSGADDADPAPGLCGGRLRRAEVFGGPVGDEALQPADADGLALLPADADFLALCLLGADASRGGGQGVVRPQDLGRAGEVAARDAGDELGDADAHGAAGDAGLVLALEAALRLLDRQGLVEAEVDLGKIAGAEAWVLLGHVDPPDLHPIFRAEGSRHGIAHAAPGGTLAPARQQASL